MPRWSRWVERRRRGNCRKLGPPRSFPPLLEFCLLELLHCTAARYAAPRSAQQRKGGGGAHLRGRGATCYSLLLQWTVNPRTVQRTQASKGGLLFGNGASLFITGGKSATMMYELGSSSSSTVL